jgi:hypothetical protein
MSLEAQLMDDQKRHRREALLRCVLYSLEDTIQLQGMKPDTPVDEVMVRFTEESAAIIAPLIEAVEILETIIWASDGCMGHRGCFHTMEPWTRARALLQGKWDAYEDNRAWPAADLPLGNVRGLELPEREAVRADAPEG